MLSERAQRPGVGIAAQARTFIMLILMPLLLVGFSPTPAVALRPALPFSLKHAAQRIRHTATRLAVDRCRQSFGIVLAFAGPFIYIDEHAWRFRILFLSCPPHICAAHLFELKQTYCLHPGSH